MTSRPPLHIDHLTIRNFRGIDDLTIEFRREVEEGGVAVLAGDNGCGKTSVLEAILLVLGQAQLLPEDAAPIEHQVRFGARDFLVQAEISPVPETLMHGLVELDLGTSASVQAFAREARPNIEYFSARREPEALGETPSPQGARSEREARRIAELKRRLISAFYRSLRSKQPFPKEIPAFDRLQTFIRPFLGIEWNIDVLPVANDPGSGDDVILRGGEIPTDITSLAMARAAAPDRTDIPPIIPIDRLSSGEVALFAFAGPLVFRDVPADIVLIDEPEQHMHPKWQRVFIEALRTLSPSSQFIVATHSVEVLDSVLSTERHLLLRDDDPRLLAWKQRSGNAP